MKLVMITEYWKNSPGGGIKTYLVSLVDHLKAAGIETDVIFYEGRDSLNYAVSGSRITGILKTLATLRPAEAVRDQHTEYLVLSAAGMPL